MPVLTSARQRHCQYLWFRVTISALTTHHTYGNAQQYRPYCNAKPMLLSAYISFCTSTRHIYALKYLAINR